MRDGLSSAYLDIGETLRRQRQAKGLTVEDIAEMTCIRPRYLTALEENRRDIWNPFPGEVYAVGFLKSFAKVLGLDPQPLAVAWRQEGGLPGS